MTTQASSVSELQTVASLIDDARVVHYNRNVFIIQATAGKISETQSLVIE
jgi:hypothetical protein